jgi:hypothetical protein
MNMRKLNLFASLCILATSLVAAPPAHAQMNGSVRLNTGGSHIHFNNQPNLVLVPGTSVYYSPYGNDEVYRYRDSWYVNRGGTWYRASSYQGPYYYVHQNQVPHAILSVPSDWRMQYRRSHGEKDRDSDWNNHQWRHHHRD